MPVRRGLCSCRNKPSTLTKTGLMRKHTLFIIISFFICSLPIYAQTADEKYADDVKSIGAIIDAYYDVISGSGKDPWQFERDKYIHSEKALITRLNDAGNAQSHSLEAEYIPLALSPRKDFYEIELKRDVSHYGNIAQVWSAFEVRSDPNIASGIRGLSSIQLYFAKGRWWISSWTTEMESDTK